MIYKRREPIEIKVLCMVNKHNIHLGLSFSAIVGNLETIQFSIK